MNAAVASAERLDRPRRHRQLYGRRVGRALTDDLERLIATRLPPLRLDLSTPPPQPLSGIFAAPVEPLSGISAATVEPPSGIFAAPVEDVWLEIGFGGGEHLFWQADHRRSIGFIGCEPFISGVAKLVRCIDEAGLGTVRLHDDDANHVLDWLPDASIGRVFVLFPDPWPKKRHRKRRFLNENGLSSLARVLRKGSELRFATDIADYAAMVTASIETRGDFAARPGLLGERPADWPLTRYAEKAIDAGRECQFFRFERV